MENLNVKDIITEIYKILDWENVGFYCIIDLYVKYLNDLYEKPKFNEKISILTNFDFKKYLQYSEQNSKRLLSDEKNKKLKEELWRENDGSPQNIKSIVRLLITALTTEQEMLAYSNYPEYVATDLLDLMIISLAKVDLEYANGFLNFSRTRFGLDNRL
ncbi:hypothetical protein I6G96_25740 [Delftia acidovorans]|uniref:hypothetical protein n=1 Tax=Delftia acidovorans TaxID=80866 RepID=UPI0018D5FEA3|nr:hypothetical protein [Delftia acidovorans]QPR34292.1 hypothetical protein I6G96_25740 [Delftia acidovorans]